MIVRAVAVLAAAAVGGASGLLLGGTAPPVEEPGAGPIRLHENVAGGYGFRQPAGWRVRDRGSTSTVTGLGGAAVVSLGHAPGGKLVEASDRFVDSLRETYRRARLAAAETRRVGPYPALLVSGTGTNREGARIRFLSITVGAPDRNYAIGVFVAADADPAEVLPPVHEIVGSFRVLAEGG